MSDRKLVSLKTQKPEKIDKTNYHVKAADNRYHTPTNMSKLMSSRLTDYSTNIKQIDTSTSKETHKTQVNVLDMSDIYSNSLNHYLSKESKKGDMRDKLNEYVNKRRDEIYARMRMPKVLVNHYSASAETSGLNISQEIPYNVFD
jgi:hypothetical protein